MTNRLEKQWMAKTMLLSTTFPALGCIINTYRHMIRAACDITSKYTRRVPIATSPLQAERTYTHLYLYPHPIH